MTRADAFVTRLTAKARLLGLARGEALLLERRGERETRWRKPRLLWPRIFTRLGSAD